MRRIGLVAVFTLLSACSISTPKYSAQPQNQVTLRGAALQPAQVGDFRANSPKLELLSVRGTPVKSSSGSFSGDIRQALELELDRAGLLSSTAGRRIEGQLVENDLNGLGFSEGRASISMEFFVREGDRIVYQKTKTVAHSWESSFIGAKAIPAASQGYLDTVTKLIASLVSDPAFQAVLK